MATLYFNNAVGNSMETLGNWWSDLAVLGEGHNNVAATALPTSADDIFITDNSAGQLFASGSVRCATAIFDSNWLLGTVYGDCFFHSASADSSAVIYGNLVFSDAAQNGSSFGGVCTGEATFGDNTSNSGMIIGDATFNDASFCGGGTITGVATFNGSITSTGSFGSVVWGASSPLPVVNGYDANGYDANGLNVNGLNSTGTGFGYDGLYYMGFSLANGWDDSTSTYWLIGVRTPLDANGRGIIGNFSYDGGAPAAVLFSSLTLPAANAVLVGLSYGYVGNVRVGTLAISPDIGGSFL